MLIKYSQEANHIQSAINQTQSLYSVLYYACHV